MSVADQILQRRTPLGVLCWDPVYDRPIEEILHLTLAPLSLPERRYAGLRTPRGVYVFHDLPGLRDWENALTPLSSEAPDRRGFALRIDDPKGRFLPAATTVQLPWTTDRLFFSSLVRQHSADAPPGFYLFSAPARRATPSLAVLSGQLRDAYTEAPASWAVLEVRIDGSEAPWYGVADARGCVRVLFPYPAPAASFVGSPATGPTLIEEWPLTLQVRYQHEDLSVVPGTDLPEAPEVMTQPYGLLHESEDLPPTTELHLSLSLGRELVLRTDELPWLSISAAPTSP